eukprot:NODE_107_length_18988_cov_0.534491.p15 type:complete len:171 gc:universal NODE_107_length_18988_cov_0.534491:6261-5749(-)
MYGIYNLNCRIYHDAIKYCILSRKLGKYLESDTLAGKIVGRYFDENLDELDALHLLENCEYHEIDYFQLLFKFQKVTSLLELHQSQEELPLEIFCNMQSVFHLAGPCNLKCSGLLYDLYHSLMMFPNCPQSLTFAAMTYFLSIKEEKNIQSYLYSILDHYAKSTMVKFTP